MVQKSLVDDIRVVVKSSNTDEVRAGTSPRDIHADKRHADVSPAIFYVSHSTISAIQFLCQVFYLLLVILCLRHVYMSAIFSVPTTFYGSTILLSESDMYQPFHPVCRPFNMTQLF
jgi:hypothetical protein